MYLSATDQGGSVNCTLQVATIVLLAMLEADKLPIEMIPDEFEYEIYLIAREHALTTQNYEFALHLSESRERSRWIKETNGDRLIVIWEALGWVEVGFHSPFWSGKKRYVLPRQYRSYPPCEKREMDEAELDQALEQARESLSKGYRITFSRGCSRETAWRLFEAGLVSCNPPRQPNMVLAPECR